MSGIAGIVRLDANFCAPEMLTNMVGAMAYWGTEGHQQHQDQTAGLAYFHTPTTPEAANERQPSLLANGEWLVAAARIDNRAELLATLNLPNELGKAMPDGTLLGHAYLQWGVAAVEHLIGDWAFAVWNPSTRRLFLARDHYGNTSLYYHANSRYIAFASSSKALLALDPSLHTIDELYVAQVILSWPAYHGARSPYTQLQRLPPAHTLIAKPDSLQTHCYWRMEDVKILPLRSLDEAIEGFLDHFDRAVECRLRANGPIATTLSGGLDSGSVSATAAFLLAQQNRPLIAYTSVPIEHDVANSERRFGNEWKLAAATASFAGISDHRPIDARQTTPLMGIEQLLWIHDAPVHACGNGYWLNDLLRTARADGVRVLLTGQGGNAGISWTGAATRRSPSPLTDRAKSLFFQLVPPTLGKRLRVWRMNHQHAWLDESLVNADFVRRIRAVERTIDDPFNIFDKSTPTPLTYRFGILQPGRATVGAAWHQDGAAFGLEVRDPTMDIRLLRYCLSVPDHLFTDPQSGMDRLLIRQAMQGRMPDATRLNQKRGLQAADLVARLRADAQSINDTLEHFAHSPAAAYLNLTKLRQNWQRIQQGNSEIRHEAALLLRALLAGYFVERPHFPRPRPHWPA